MRNPRPKYFLITSQVINERNYLRFGLDQIEKGSDLTVIDATPFCYPLIYDRQKREARNDLKQITISSQNEPRNIEFYAAKLRVRCSHLCLGELRYRLLGTKSPTSEIRGVAPEYHYSKPTNLDGFALQILA